jgi:hypothetical protein
MTSPLTPQQLADVAREVTGKPHYKHRWWGQDVITDNEYLCVENVYIVNFWNPQFVHDDHRRPDWQRSQALALVEWLNDYFSTPREKTRKEASKMSELNDFLEAFHKRDISALQRMVIELKGAA